MKVHFHLDKAVQPQSEKGMKVLYGQAKRGGYRLRWYLMLALVISPVLAMAYYLYRDNILVIAPAIITSQPVTIKASGEGIVGPMNLVVGSPVSQGQEIVTITNFSLLEELTFIKSEIQKLNHENTRNFDNYQRAVANSKQNVAKIHAIRVRYDKYRAKGQVSDVDYASMINLSNSAVNDLNAKEIDYNNAQIADNERHLAGPVSQSRRALMKELVIKEDQNQRLTAVSPYEGRIVDIAVIEGQSVEKGDSIATVAKNVTPQVVAYLNPKYLNVAQLGHQATVNFPDGQSFEASVSEAVEVVSKIPAQLTKPFEGQPAYLKVALTFDEALETSRWIEGMTVEVRF